MKKILFPTLLIATLIAGGVVALAIWRAAPATAQDSITEARKSYEQKDYQTAGIHVMNALQQDSRNREAHILLSEILTSQAQYNAAANQLMKLLEYYPNDREAKLRLGALYLSGGETGLKRAVEIAEELIKANDKDVEGLILKGNAKAGLKDFRASTDAFEQVVSIDPQNSTAFVSLGTSQIFQKQLPEAEQAYLKAKELDPKSKAALTSLGNYYRAAKDTPKAEATFKEAVALYPTDPQVYWPLAELYFQVGRMEDAVRLLRETQAKDPKRPQAGILLSELYMANKQPAEARKTLMDLKKSADLKEDLALAAKLAATAMRDDPATARAEIDLIMKKQPGNPAGPILLGELQMNAGELDAAKATLSQVVNSGHPQVLHLLGSIEAKKGQLDSAIDYFQKAAIDNAPSSILSRTALASALMDKGRIADARVEIKKALELNSRFVPARLVEAAVDRAEKRYADSEKKLSSLIAEQPDNAEMYGQLALTQLAMNRIPDAEKSLVKARELQPDSFDRFRILTLFYMQTRQPQKAIQALNGFPENKRDAKYYELLGGVYADTGKNADAEAALKKAIEMDSKNAEASNMLARLYIASGRLNESVQTLDAFIQKNPANAGAHTIKGMVQEAQGNVDAAMDTYARAIQIDPNSDLAANNLAYILAERSLNLEKALSLAQNARKRAPNDPSVADTLGWVYFKMGNHTMAIDQLQFALSKMPDNPVLHYHIGMAYKGNKQTKEAAESLRKAVASSQNFKEKALAQAALKEIGN